MRDASAQQPQLVVVRSFWPTQDCAGLTRILERLPLVAVPGRQGGGYAKAELLATDDVAVVAVISALRTVLHEPPGIDAWSISYPAGSAIPVHTDPSPADGLVHVRANLLLEAAVGGVFVGDDVAVDLAVGDLVVFRPDVVRHAVTTVQRGHRRVLSVGTVMSASSASSCLTSLFDQR
jgi:hypothetical protein